MDKASPKYFSFSDAWVFASLSGYKSSPKPINLSEIIARGDALNISILSIDELKSGFEKLQVKGLIKIEGENLIVTKLGQEVRARAAKMRGGRFSFVENTLNKLNSRRASHRDINKSVISKYEFLSDQLHQDGHEKYVSMFRSG